MTPLGLPGSVLFAGDSFSPETSHFEVVLPKTMDRNKFSGSLWIKPRTTVGDKILIVRQEILPQFFNSDDFINFLFHVIFRTSPTR